MIHDLDFGSLQQPSIEIWQRLAPWWDGQLGETGNEFQQQLINPATDRLLEPRAGQEILEIACGNGNYTRTLARRGAHVVAFDVSRAFIERAKLYPPVPTEEGSIDYRVINATDADAVRALGRQRRFDAAVCNMALMDIAVIDPLIGALREVLKPAARFVFSLPHPCFNSAASRMTAELVNEEGKLEQVYGVSIRRYLTPAADLSAGILNQPEPHYLFHRPLSQIVRWLTAGGFVVDGMEEPAFPSGATARNPFSWAKRPDIPPAIVIRARLIA